MHEPCFSSAPATLLHRNMDSTLLHSLSVSLMRKQPKLKHKRAVQPHARFCAMVVCTDNFKKLSLRWGAITMFIPEFFIITSFFLKKLETQGGPLLSSLQRMISLILRTHEGATATCCSPPSSSPWRREVATIQQRPVLHTTLALSTAPSPPSRHTVFCSLWEGDV